MMYSLLRDNKQSGPYSLDELKVKGLKAYDLVWVDGRSAAWRYPSEIEELSAFAPAVEEQPFDRFYKKPATAKKEAGMPAEIPANTAVVTMTQPSASSYPPTTKRTIYVTMPGGIAARENGREASPAREVLPAREVIREITPVREPAAIRERVPYMQEPMAEILPPLSRRKRVNVWLPIAIGGAMLVLLAAGIVIGLSIQKSSGGLLNLASKDKEQAAVRTTAQPLPISPSTNAGQTTDPNGTNAQAAPEKSTAPVENAAGADRTVTRARLTTQKQKAEPPKTSAVVPAMTTDSQAVQSAPRQETVRRTDVIQSPPADAHESARAALANAISVGTNKFDIGTFGGIRNLQVTVTNRSAYSLDLVVVAVSYIQSNKKIYKTENLYFRSIGPGSALMLEAPKSSRGITIQYKVTSVSSKELGLSEPGI